MGKYKTLALNSIYVFVGGGLSKIVSFVMLPFYTKWLTAKQFGEVDLISVYSSLLLGLCTFCVAEAIFVMPQNESIERQKKFYTTGIVYTIVLLLIAGLCIMGICNYLSNKGIDNFFIYNKWYIYMMIVVTFFQVYSQQFSRALNAVKIFSFTGVVQALSTATLGIILIPKYGLIGYIYSMILSSILAILYTTIFSHSYKYFSLRNLDKTIYKDLLKYSIPLVPNSLMFWVVNALNKPIIEAHVGLAAVGILAVANKFPSVITMCFELFSKSWQISMMEEYRKDGFNSFFNNIFKLIVIFLCLLGSLLAVFSDIIINLFTSAEFESAAYYMPLLGFSVVLTCIGYFVGAIFLAAKESKYFFYSSIIGALVSLICNIIFIPLFGLIGAILSIIFSFASIAFARILYSRKFVRITEIKQFVLTMLLYMVLIFMCMYTHIFVLKIAMFLFFAVLSLFIYRDSYRLILKKIIK